MLTQSNPVISRLDVIGSLARLREEWQEAVDGQSLIDVQGSVGLLLGDVVMLLGLSADEQSAVLEFWRKGSYTFPVAMRSDETRAGFGPINGTPTLFLIDRSGTVRLKHLGTLPDGALEAQINTLLK